MKKSLLRLVSCISAFCILLGAVGSDGLLSVMTVLGGTDPQNTMQDIEELFAGYLYDGVSERIGATSVLISDETVSNLEHYESKYKDGGYTSLADYMYSKDSEDNLVRDMDYGTNGNGKTGFLYYKEAMTDFEISFDYRYTTESKAGWNGFYVGFGAERMGQVWPQSNENSVIYIQPNDHHLLCGSTTNISSFEKNKVNYSDALTKRQNDTAGTAWYTFKLRMEDGIAKWYVDNNLIATYTPENYEGGYIYFGTMAGKSAFRNISVKNLTGYYGSMAEIERDFKAAFYDTAAANIDKNATLITDDTITSLEKYNKYQQGNYTSLADYLFSVDTDGNLVRDIDYGTSGDKKIGFLYYNKALDEFTIELEYRHSLATKSVGQKSIYIGYGAQKIGNHAYNDEVSGAVKIQPEDMNLYAGGSRFKQYKNNQNFKTGVAAVYQADLESGTPSWYKLKLTVQNSKVTWEINGKSFSCDLEGYLGGYIYISAMTKDTAFRNIKITELEKTVDTSAYKVYHTKNGTRLDTDGQLEKVDFEKCWSLDEGTFTRIGEGDYAGGPKGKNGESLLYFDKKYDAFKLELEYQFGSDKNTWMWAAVGYGADNAGSSYANGDGYMVFVEKEGYISYNYPKGEGTASSRLKTDKNTAYEDDVKLTPASSWHKLTVTVQSGMMTVAYDNVTAVKTAVSDYAGYIYLMSFTPEMKYKNVSIVELADADLSWAEDYDAYYKTSNTDFRTDTAKFTKTDILNVWGYDDGSIVRMGSGDFGGGSGVKGMAALYFKEKYDNFVLEYDYNFSGSKSGWRWASAGFGATEMGDYFKTDNSYYMFVEKEGYRSYNCGTQSGRIAGAGLIEDYFDLVENGDNTWHHFRLVVANGKAALYIDNYDVAEISLSNYNKGYVSILSNTPEMKFKNISITEISYIKSTEELTPITADLGTEQSAISFPAKIDVTLGDDLNKELSVKEWKCLDYNPQKAGTYIFTGELDLTGSGIYEKDQNRFVKLSVTLADYDTSAVKEYVFLSENQLNAAFKAYYVGKDKEFHKGAPLKEATPSQLWDVSDAGGVIRAGSGDYEGTTSGAKSASLLYFNEKQTEFELDFDYCFNGTTQSWKWVAFGVGAEEYGKAGYDENGGSLFCIENEGQIRKLQPETQPLLTDKEAFKGYKESLSDATLNRTIWHHVKLAVKNSTVYIYVDDYPVVTSALDNYNGGYIYLLGCTKNLEFKNIKISKIKTASVTSEIPYSAVPIGTSVDDIALPATLEINLDGKKVNCPVEWSSSDYNGNSEGTYIFYATPTGKYSHIWLTENAKRAIACVSVGNFDDEIVHKFALNSMEELEAYFTNYYCENKKEFTETGAWKPTNIGNTWGVSGDGYVMRAGSGNYAGGAKGTFGAAALYYNKKLVNFEVEYDYRHGKSGWRWHQVLGFGAEKIGDTYADMGYLPYVEREGDITLRGTTKGSEKSFNVSNPFPTNRFMTGYNDKFLEINKGADEWHHIRLSVIDGVLRIYGDDGSLWKADLGDDYNGGYIYFLQNSANSAMKNLSITDYDAKAVDIVSMQTAEQLGCAYQAIDKTKGDAITFAESVIAKDRNGYSYNLPIEWKAPSNYRSGILGKFNFSGVPVMPSAKFRNPDNISTNAVVETVKVDYNTKNTIKYYFDHENDMLDFTNYYTEDVMQSDLAANDWREQWVLSDGTLQRLDDDFKSLDGPSKYKTVKKVARLTYNEALSGNIQIDFDYKQDKNTWMWPMLCFSIKDKTRFVTDYDPKNSDEFFKNEVGGVAAYLEREGYVNFWGNMAQTNQNYIRIRATVMADKLVGYDHTKPHHMKLTFINGVARLYIDDYETTYAVRVPDAARGEFIALMTNGNASTFDNFAITRLSSDATEGIDIDGDEVEIVVKNSEHKEAAVKSTQVEKGKVAIAIAITAVAVIVLAVSGLILFKSKNKVRK